MERAQRRLAGVLVTDIAGYTALAHRDEGAALNLLRTHERIAKPLFDAYDGRLVKSLGDGFLVEFGSVLQAVACALALQEQLQSEPPGPSNLRVRIGVHVCDVEHVDGDILGDGVNIASRIQELADPGGICITEDVHRQVRGRLAARFEPMGRRRLRNIDESVVLFRVQPQGGPVSREVHGTRSGSGIAVLPFSNASSDPDNDHFCLGLADELINALTKTAHLRVLSRTSSFSPRIQGLPATEVGKLLGVHALVEGSVRKSGSRIRVSAQLIDAETDEHLWSDIYDREIEDVFAVQAEITRNIVQALRGALESDVQDGRRVAHPVEVEAYELYLRGMQAYFRGDLPSYRAARSFFRKAIAIEPGFARAHAALAQCAAYHHLYWQAGRDILEEARMASAKAMELAPDEPESCVARGLTLSLEGRYTEAEAAFRDAARLGPTCYDAWYALGRCLFTQARFEESIAAFRRAAAVRIDDYQSLGLALTAYKAIGDEDGRAATARELLPPLRRHRQLNPDDARACYFEASIHSTLGERDESLRCIAHALELGPEDPTILYNVSCVYCLLGMSDEALQYLRRTADAGFVDVDWIDRDDDLGALRIDPRFADVVARIRRNREAAGLDQASPQGPTDA